MSAAPTPTESAWDPAQYERFKQERERPFHDLAAMLRPGWRPRVLDLGCGTGRLTRILHERLGAAETVGVDSAAPMLAKAQAHATPSLRFDQGDLARWEGDPYDLVFSNAALQWVDDHPALLERLARLVAPGGQLAFQVPDNYGHPVYAAAGTVAREPSFADALRGWVRESPVLQPEDYALRLRRLGFERVEVVLRVYVHELPSVAEAVEWTKGTLLTAYQERLSPAAYEAFVGRYREVLAEAVGDERPYPFTFRRIFAWGQRPK